MVNKDVLVNLYESDLLIGDISTKNLNALGINGNNIGKLVSDGVLTRVCWGVYEFKDLDGLVLYGKRLFDEGKFAKAESVFLKCYELDSSNDDVLMHLFGLRIFNSDFDGSIKYLRSLLNSSNSSIQSDAEFYLFIMKFFKKLPEDLAQREKIADNYCMDENYNLVRRLAYKASFSGANKALKEFIHPDDLKKKITSQLLSLASIYFNRGAIIDLIKNKKYKELLDYYETRVPANAPKCSDKVVVDMLRVLSGEEEIANLMFSSQQADDFIDAFYLGNYRLALEISEEKLKKRGINLYSSIPYLLLRDLNEKIDEYSVKQQYLYIVEVLLGSNPERALELVDIYLGNIGALRYSVLVKNLIKISIKMRDISFVDAILALTNVSFDSYVFDGSIYVKRCCDAIDAGKFEIAQLYLEIVKSNPEIRKHPNIIRSLENLLEGASAITRRDEQTSEVMETKEKEPAQVKEEVKPVMPEKEKQKKKLDLEASILEAANYNNSLYAEEIVKKVRATGDIELIPNLNNAHIRTLKMKFDAFNGIKSYIINYAGEKYLMVKPSNYKRRNYTKIIEEGKWASTNGDYEKALAAFKEALNNPYVTGKNLASIGYVYTKMGRSFDAIPYFKAATFFNKKRGKDKDYTWIVDSIMQYSKAPVKDEDKKPFVKMSVNDFTNQDEYYGINGFEEILNYMLTNKVSLQNACTSLGYTDDEINIIRIIFAKKYYKQGDTSKGDEFLKAAIQSEKKSVFVLGLIKEVQANKTLYTCQKETSGQILSLNFKVK